MIKLSLPYIYQLAENLEPLTRIPQIPGVKYRDIFISLMVAQSVLSNFNNNSVFASSVRTSRRLADKLISLIQEITQGDPDPDREIDGFTIFQISNSFEQYKIALQAELEITPAFFVTQKGSHDTLSLLDDSVTLFPDSLRNKVPEALFDVKEAGKAIAFDMPTACGYHLFRATESVVRRYYSVLTNNAPALKVRSLGVYVKMLRSSKNGDEKILASLDQMTRLHRNPIIHPEIALSMDDALSIVGISRSVVTAMLDVLPTAPTTTATAS